MTLSPMDPNVSDIYCIGVLSSLMLGLWCKRIEVGFESQSDVFYSRATTISAKHSSQKKSISGLNQASEQSDFNGKDQATKHINHHRDFGATKLPNI